MQAYKRVHLHPPRSKSPTIAPTTAQVTHSGNVITHLKCESNWLTLKVLVTTIDAQWEGMGDVGSARYEPALLPPCPTIRVLSYSH